MNMMSMTCSFSFNHRICIYEVGGTKQDTKPISPYLSSFNVTVLADRKQKQAKEVTGVSHLSYRVYSTNVFLKKMKVCDEHTHKKNHLPYQTCYIFQAQLINPYRS